MIVRNINGASNEVTRVNGTTDAILSAAVREAERQARCFPEQSSLDLESRAELEPVMTPKLFSDATYQLDSPHRADAVHHLASLAADAGVLSAGYVQTSAHSIAVLDSHGRERYFSFTQAQYSVTVRDPQGTGSGWAGVDGHDWSRIDAAALTATALKKCLDARHPVAIEPGRYTTILEPQAVCDFVGPLIYGFWLNIGDQMNREGLEHPSIGGNGAFYKAPASGDKPQRTRLGERVVDTRITISADPTDPDAGFPPFEMYKIGDRLDPTKSEVYHPVTWIEDGVLKNLSYSRDYAVDKLGRPTGLRNPGAFHRNGGPTSIDEMIATTRRGLLVTRFTQVQTLDSRSTLLRGFTRDGLWFIENGKISKPAKNLAFTEGILAALNNIDQIGPAQRTFHPVSSPFGIFVNPQPVIVPALKINDFSFTALSDAV